MMEMLDVMLKVPKESKEVIDLLAGVAVKIKEGADVQDYLSLIGELSSALDGIDKVPTEAKSEGRTEIVAYMVHKMMPILVPVNEAGE